MTQTTGDQPDPRPPADSQEVIPMTDPIPEPDFTWSYRSEAMGLTQAESAVWRHEGAVIPGDVEAWRADHAEQISAQEAREAELERYMDEVHAEFWAEQKHERQIHAEEPQAPDDLEAETERRADPSCVEFWEADGFLDPEAEIE